MISYLCVLGQLTTTLSCPRCPAFIMRLNWQLPSIGVTDYRDNRCDAIPYANSELSRRRTSLKSVHETSGADARR